MHCATIKIMILCSEHFTYLIVTYGRTCKMSTNIMTGTVAQRGASGTMNIVKITYIS